MKQIKANGKLLFILTTVIAIGTLAVKNFSVKSVNNNYSKTLAQKPIPTLTPIYTPTPTLTPTPTPTPTPIPKPTGFCLNVPVLFYHHIENLAKAQSEGHKFETVAPEYFESQMQYLVAHGYRTIKAEELINAIYSHQSLGKVAVVSIDDGYDDAYTNAYQIAKKYGVTLSLMIATGLLENPGYINWGQLKEIVDSGNGAYDHTWSHFSLNLGDDAKITSEVMTAKSQLDSHLGTNQTILTYPYGGYNQKVINFLINNGFKAAFTILPGRLNCEGNVMNLPRVRVGNAPLSAYGL